MNPSKVLLITLVGPYGEVDVAVRADLPASELLPAFNELVGRGGKRRQQAQEGSGSERQGSQNPRSTPQPQAAGYGPPPQNPGYGSQPPDYGSPPPGYGSPPPDYGSQPQAPGSSGPPPRDPGPGGGRHRQGAPQQQPRHPADAAPQSPPQPQGPAGHGGGGSATRESPVDEPSRQDIPLQGTLADAGIVDGTVLYLYRASEKTEASR